MFTDFSIPLACQRRNRNTKLIESLLSHTLQRLDQRINFQRFSNQPKNRKNESTDKIPIPNYDGYVRSFVPSFHQLVQKFVWVLFQILKILMSQTGFDLLSPNILLFVDFHSLVKLKQLCKFYQKSVDDESKSLGYWPAVCNSFCYYGGIFSPVIFNPEFIYPINYRKHFFEDLWPQRSKWATLSEDGHHIIPSTQAYKVRVACRFRPGETQEGRVCLPLHQFLKLKRQQKLKQQQEVTEILVGEKDPEEFLDPFLGSLMKDPVLLKTSNRVCDRSVALQCILRGGRDPFNNRKLSQAMLEPLPELANRIREWKAKADERKDVSVDINETKSLVDASGFNNDLLEALLEIESIHRTMKKIKEQESSDLGFSNHDNFEAPLAGVNEPLEPQNEMPAPNEIVGVGLDGGDEFIAEVENTEPNFFGLNGNAHITSTSSQEDQLPGKKAERARVTDVNHQQGFVSMHIPGAGIRPFHYSQVYPTTTKQLEIYEASVKESVHSVLNGCNSCVMCYGQTGSGKTFTFLGPEGCLENLQGEDRDLANIFTQYPTLGLVLRTTDDLFLAKDHFEKYQITMNIGIQMIEVYDEKVNILMVSHTFFDFSYSFRLLIYLLVVL